MSQEEILESEKSEVEQPQTRRDIEAQIITRAWKDEVYKQELLANPKAVLENEIGIEFNEEVNVKVLEENSTSLYFVLPMSPQIDNKELSEEELETVAGGIIGLTLAAADVALTSYMLFGESGGGGGEGGRKRRQRGGNRGSGNPQNIGNKIRKSYHG